jgi:FHS family glucose/mannose:H+ symporter-like MFS transporter
MKSMATLLKVKREDRPLMYTIYYAFFVSGMMSTLIGALLPFMKSEYQMSYVLSGAVLSAHQIGNFSALLIAGVLPYLIGRKRSTLTLAMGIVIGFLLITLTANPLLLLLAFAFTGIGRGTFSNITNVVMSEIAENKAASLNLLHAVFAVGAFLAPFIAILATVVLNVGWRVSAWLLVAFELIALLFISRSTLSSEPTKRSKGGEASFLRSSEFWINAATLFFYLCNEASIMGWLVTYFTDTGRLSPALAQTTSSALWIFILVGRLLCAYLASKMNKNLLLIILGALQLSFFIMMITVDSITLIYLSIFGFGLSMSGTYPTILSTVDSKLTSSTIAMGSLIAVATLGAILMPTIVGSIAQVQGMAGGLATISVAIGVMLFLMIIKFIRSYRGQHIQ